MQFLVSEIKDAQIVEREESVNAVDLIGPPPAFVTFRQPVHSRVQARMTRDGEIVFSGRVSTVITNQCGRCLEFFDKPVNLEFQQVVSPEQPVVDITGEIRETLLVEMPVRAVCREECKGFCATCGKNLNAGSCNCKEKHTDPRWDALKSFHTK